VSLAAILLAVCAGPVLGQPAAASEPGNGRWLDSDGRPLPFQTDGEVLEFLRTAEIVKTRKIPKGITKPQKLLLEKDGIRAHACFRYVDKERKDISVEGRHYRRFRDSSRFEIAAYELALRLGLDSVPPTVPRKVSGRSGSLQIWIEDGRDETARDFKPKSVFAWVKQTWDRDLFDNLILNVDRNSGNQLAGENDKLWLIDHTRAFQPQPELLDPESLQRVNREAWKRLLAMDEGALKEAVGDHLDGEEFMCLAARRERLIEHVEALVAERGEAVFY
jgi:hypothetical protein